MSRRNQPPNRDQLGGVVPTKRAGRSKSPRLVSSRSGPWPSSNDPTQPPQPSSAAMGAAAVAETATQARLQTLHPLMLNHAAARCILCGDTPGKKHACVVCCGEQRSKELELEQTQTTSGRPGSPRVTFAPHSPVMTSYIPPYVPGMPTHSPVTAPHSPRFSYLPEPLHHLPVTHGLVRTAQFAAAATSRALADHGFERLDVGAGVYAQDYSWVPDARRVPMWAGLPQPVFASAPVPMSEIFAHPMDPPWRPSSPAAMPMAPVRPRSPILAERKNEYDPGYRTYLPPGAMATAPGIYNARSDPTPSIHDLGHRPSQFVIFY
jgi:hypothetical protein